VRIDASAAWKLLQQAKIITTAKGKKVSQWKPEADEKEAILKHVMGPSGNLRAPTYRVKDEFIVGFNSDLYARWMGE